MTSSEARFFYHSDKREIVMHFDHIGAHVLGGT